MTNFNNYYQDLLLKFKELGTFDEIKPNESNIEWPNKSGVYVIWDNSSIEGRLVYVGLTGKFIRSKDDSITIFKGATFKSRTNRWTPYRFCENKKDTDYKFHFRFGPKYSNVAIQSKAKFDSDSYREAIPYRSLMIHCFEVDEKNSEYSPILLESEILTRYLKTFGDLQVANNSL